MTQTSNYIPDCMQDAMHQEQETVAACCGCSAITLMVFIAYQNQKQSFLEYVVCSMTPLGFAMSLMRGIDNNIIRHVNKVTVTVGAPHK